MILDFRQIIWKDEQLPHLYDFATPYRNDRVGKDLLLFENAVIADLVPRSEADLIGICSWRLKEKRNEASTPGILIRAHGDNLLSAERILGGDFDVAVLTPRNNLHRPLAMASNWHGKAWDDAFVVLKRHLYDQHHLKVPDELTHTIYENHFVARGDIYRTYVRDCLIPCVDFVCSDPVFSVDAGYAKRKRAQDVAEFTAKTGLKDWPIMPFILERLFMIWIEKKNLKVIPL